MYTIGSKVPALKQVFKGRRPNVGSFTGGGGFSLPFFQQSRSIHSGASGSLKHYNDVAKVKELQEPTIFSTFDSHEINALANPKYHETVKNLEDNGHKVVPNVDLTQLHNLEHPGTQELNKVSKESGIPIHDDLQMSFLRHPSEEEGQDRSLLRQVMESAYASGVQKVTPTHTAFEDSPLAKGAPGEKAWKQAGDGLYQHQGTTITPQHGIVESVLRDGGSTQDFKLNKSATSSFTRLEDRI